MTDAGALGARWIIHAVSLDHERRTSAAAIERAVRSALARARELGVETLAIPALGTGVGGFPLAEAARITVATVRAEAPRLPRLRTITFALRGAAAYEAFRAGARHARGGRRAGRRAVARDRDAPARSRRPSSAPSSSRRSPARSCSTA